VERNGELLKSLKEVIDEVEINFSSSLLMGKGGKKWSLEFGR